MNEYSFSYLNLNIGVPEMTSRKKKKKYHFILDAALKVIAENGYHNAQVSRIAKEAGVADGTIYLYFKNKEDILISLFRDRSETSYSCFTTAFRKPIPRMKRFAKYAKFTSPSWRRTSTWPT